MLSRTTLSLPALLAAPLQELLEQTVLGCPIVWRHARCLFARQGGIDVARRGRRRRVEPLLQRTEALPSRHLAGEVYVLPPLVVAGFLLQLIEAIEQVVDQPNQALVAVGVRGPVIDGEHGRNRDSRDLLTLRDQTGIVGMFELGRRVVLELRVVFHGEKPEALGPLAFQ